jgi:hypothetical protein
MNLQSLFPRIMGFLVIIITLALAPQIVLSNNAIADYTHLANFTGMEAMSSFGAPLIILGLLVSGGIFAIAGLKGRLAGAGVKDMLGVIGSVIIIIIALSFFLSILGYCYTLLTASSGDFGGVIYGIIPLIIYVGIIAGAGWFQVQTYRKLRKGGGSRRMRAAPNF